MNEVIVAGLLLGASAGFAPGPLMTLVILQSLRHGIKEGCKTALVPLITDLPVVALSLLVTASLQQMRPFLGLISLAGGLFVLRLAWQSFRPLRIDAGSQGEEPKSWRKGIVTNILSPNPWLFWFTVGAATVLKARQSGWLAVLLFFVIFYLLLCGIKGGIAVVTGKSREFIGGHTHGVIIKALGVALAAYALLLFRDAYRYLN